MPIRSLSRTEAKIVLGLEADDREVVTLREIRSITGASPGFARKLAHGLKAKGWLQPVRRGVYLLSPSDRGPEALPDADPFRVGSVLADPYYFGFATAAELHGLLPQASRVYYVVTPRRLSPRSFGGSRFQPVHVAEDRFFGTQGLERRGHALVVSDPERTLLDCIERPDFAGGLGGVAQILGHLKPRLDWHRRRRHLARWGNQSLRRRVGYLVEHVRPSARPPRTWTRWVRASAREPYAPLGPPGRYGRRGRHDARWRLVINVPDRELYAEGRPP